MDKKVGMLTCKHVDDIVIGRLLLLGLKGECWHMCHCVHKGDCQVEAEQDFAGDGYVEVLVVQEHHHLHQDP